VSGGLGPRFLIEAGFIVGVAVVAGLERLSTAAIVSVMAGAWLVVALIEWGIAKFDVAHRLQVGALPAAEREPEPAPEPEVVPGPEPEPPTQPPEPLPERPAPEPERPVEQPRVALAPTPHEPGPEPAPKLEPAAEPEPKPVRPPEPKPVRPEPEPEPKPVRPPEPEAEPQPTVVSAASRFPGPREWNLWELERLARESTGRDQARDEERSFMLMYLREFANADGLLPADFDGLVRESFGDLLDAAPA
jgi:hypothetical protein